MNVPPRLLLPLAGIGLVGFIAVGLFAAGRANRLGEGAEVREQAVSVPAQDGFPLAVRLVELRGSGARRPAVLVGLPADATRTVLARALARRGWSVAVMDLRGSGASRNANGTAVALAQASEGWARDTVDVAAWLAALPGTAAERPALIGVRAGAGAALEAKGTGGTFGSLALVLPTVPDRTNPVGAPAYRTTPSGVLVAGSGPFTLPDAVAGFLTDPHRSVEVPETTIAAIAEDAAFLTVLDGWLRNPGYGL